MIDLVILMESVWGDEMIQTAGNFAGEISEVDYLPVLHTILACFEAANVEATRLNEEGEPMPATTDLDFNDAISTYLGNFIEY